MKNKMPATRFVTVEFLLGFGFYIGHFSYVCNSPFYAERRYDLVTQVLIWNQENLSSLPAGFPATALKKWQQQNQKVMTCDAENNQGRN